jgi:hypothetical protein
MLGRIAGYCGAAFLFLIMTSGWWAAFDFNRGGKGLAELSSKGEARGSAGAFFVENSGQFNEEVRYLMYGSSFRMGLAEDSLSIDSSQYPGETVKLSFPGSRSGVSLEGVARSGARVSYLYGSDPSKWLRDVPVWGTIRYKDLYPGLDLVLDGRQEDALIQLDCKAGCRDSAQVQLQLEGVRSAWWEGDYLVFAAWSGTQRIPFLFPQGLFDESRPQLVWIQTIEDNQVHLPFIAHTINDWVAPGLPIPPPPPPETEPPTFWATLLGGERGEWANAITRDDQGSLYVAGRTTSWDFPATPGAYDETCGVDGDCDFVDERGYQSDIFVAKLSPDASTLEYATFIGGIMDEYAYDIVVDQDGAAFVIGNTYSWDFPTTEGAFNRTGAYGAPYVLKLNPSGSELEYSTFLAESSSRAYGIDIDDTGAAYITGSASPNSYGFPTTPGAFVNWAGLLNHVYILKMNPEGSDLEFGAVIGEGEGTAIRVGSEGEVYVGGTALSEEFPTTEDAVFPEHQGGSFEGFLLSLNPDGSDLTYSTFLGGSGSDQIVDIALGEDGSLYAAGNTTSHDFPVTERAYDENQRAMFVTRINPEGTALIFSTYIGGSNQDLLTSLGLAEDGRIFLGGWTKSEDFPVTEDAVDVTCGVDGKCGAAEYPDIYNWDGFIAVLDANGENLVYGTFIGGSRDDMVEGIHVRRGVVSFTGVAASPDLVLPPGGFQNELRGSTDALVGLIQINQ